MRGTLLRVRAADEAWNARRWDDYAGALDDELWAWVSGDAQAHGKPDHLERQRGFCAAFPDARRHVADGHIDLFASHDGQRSVSVTRLTGAATGALRLPGTLPLVATRHRFDITLAIVCRWRDGRIVEQREFIDQDLMVRQLGGDARLLLSQGDNHGGD